MSHPSDTVVRKIRAAEGHPGVLDALELALAGPARTIIAQRHGAIRRAHLKPRADADQPTPFKLPATRALALAGHPPNVPEGRGYEEIPYEEQGEVGYLHFDFYNGAMSSEQCGRLRQAYLYARRVRRRRCWC